MAFYPRLPKQTVGFARLTTSNVNDGCRRRPTQL